MAELAGKLNQVWGLAGSTAMTNATGAKVFGVDNASWRALCDILEISQFGDTYKNRMGGLLDTSVNISGNLDPTDTNGQNILIPGNTIHIGIYPQGTGVAGKQVKAIVESFEQTAEVSGKQTFTASILGIAAPVSLPSRP
jgi:hypothetical protein